MVKMKCVTCMCVLWLALVRRSLSQASYFEKDNRQEPEIDEVYLEQQPGNGQELFPYTYRLSVQYKDELLDFFLRRDDDVTKSLNPSVFRLSEFLPSEAMKDNNVHEFAYYHNREAEKSSLRAGFVLQRSSTETEAKVYGVFNYNNRIYFLEYKQRDEQHQIREDTRTNQRFRRASYKSTTYTLETFVWSAPDVFRFHRSRLGLNGRDTENTFLRTWERAIIRDIDLIFRNIDTVDMRVVYVGGGNDRDLSIPWYSDNVQGDLIRRTALMNVTTYIQGLVANNLAPVSDHTVVLTRQYLVDRFSLAGQDKIAFGVVDSVCTGSQGSSVSMAEISSPFFTKAVAQSILFGFGLVYTDDILDVQDSFTVMSREVNTNIPFAKRADRWRLGRKSADALKTKIDLLNPNCLLQESQEYPGIDQYFGEVYPTLTEQCQIIAGASSDVCQLDSNSQCYANVKCLDSRGNCDVDYFSGDSTPCDVDKSCRFGDCSFTGVTTTTERNLQSSTTLSPVPDCCCEIRDIGSVNVNVLFEPCDS